MPHPFLTKLALSLALCCQALADVSFFPHRNEEDVGKAIKKSGIPREDIFVTTKARTISILNIYVMLTHSMIKSLLAMEFRSWKGKGIESIRSKLKEVSQV